MCNAMERGRRDAPPSRWTTSIIWTRWWMENISCGPSSSIWKANGAEGDTATGFLNSQAEHWYVKWDWVRHGSEVELKINNTDMVHAGRLNTTKVAIDVALALKMGWLIQKENQDYTLGSNLHWEYIERDINRPWLCEIEQGIPNFQLKRDWADLPDERGVNAFWRVT